MSDTATVLRIRDIHVHIQGRKRITKVLHEVSVDLEQGSMRGLVGETGSGKSMTARAVMGLLPPGGSVVEGSVLLHGQELVGLTDDELHGFRGAVISMVFQNPRAALYPMVTVESQLGNIIKAHRDLKKRERRDRIRNFLEMVGMPDPERVARSYPHELSGGMAQRVVIAAALINEPTVLIADEPTTGLDATIQRQILELLAELQRELDLSVLMITHDIGIVAQYCDSVSVMNDGLVVESGSTHKVLLEPEHPYTQQLIAASELSEVGAAKQRGAA
jgi:ABC-type dipeptide/oligopeptide/nickel transport system ATPase component